MVQVQILYRPSGDVKWQIGICINHMEDQVKIDIIELVIDVSFHISPEKKGHIFVTTVKNQMVLA